MFSFIIWMILKNYLFLSSKYFPIDNYILFFSAVKGKAEAAKLSPPDSDKKHRSQRMTCTSSKGLHRKEHAKRHHLPHRQHRTRQGTAMKRQSEETAVNEAPASEDLPEDSVTKDTETVNTAADSNVEATEVTDVKELESSGQASKQTTDISVTNIDIDSQSTPCEPAATEGSADTESCIDKVSSEHAAQMDKVQIPETGDKASKEESVTPTPDTGQSEPDAAKSETEKTLDPTRVVTKETTVTEPSANTTEGTSKSPIPHVKEAANSKTEGGKAESPSKPHDRHHHNKQRSSSSASKPALGDRTKHSSGGSGSSHRDKKSERTTRVEKSSGDKSKSSHHHSHHSSKSSHRSHSHRPKSDTKDKSTGEKPVSVDGKDVSPNTVTSRLSEPNNAPGTNAEKSTAIQNTDTVPSELEASTVNKTPTKDLNAPQLQDGSTTAVSAQDTTTTTTTVEAVSIPATPSDQADSDKGPTAQIGSAPVVAPTDSVASNEAKDPKSDSHRSSSSHHSKDHHRSHHRSHHKHKHRHHSREDRPSSGSSHGSSRDKTSTSQDKSSSSQEKSTSSQNKPPSSSTQEKSSSSRSSSSHHKDKHRFVFYILSCLFCLLIVLC